MTDLLPHRWLYVCVHCLCVSPLPPFPQDLCLGCPQLQDLAEALNNSMLCVVM